MPPTFDDKEREQIRRSLSDPWRVVAALGLDHGAVRERRNVKIVCPWCHGGRHTPPCSIRTKNGALQVHCFSCHAGGDLFALIAAAEGLDPRRQFVQVLQRAATLANLPSPPLQPTSPRQERKAHLLDASAWHRGATGLLTLCPLAGSLREGLSARGILAEAQADGWGELPEEPSSLLAALQEQALLGFVPWLLDDGGQIFKPQHRLCIPWRALDGKCWQVQRRYAPCTGSEPSPQGDKYREPTGSRASPTSPHPYGVENPELASAEEVWLVEGATDVLALRALNRRGYLRRDHQPRAMVALGLPGVGAWARVRDATAPHLWGRRVVIALDRDKAGNAQVRRLAADCLALDAGSVADKSPPPDHKDWADAAAHHARENHW